MMESELQKIERRFQRWLDNGGTEELAAATARAKAVSEQMAKATLTDWQTAERPLSGVTAACAYPGYKGAPRR